MSSGGVGVPVKILHESVGHIVTVGKKNKCSSQIFDFVTISFFFLSMKEN